MLKNEEEDEGRPKPNKPSKGPRKLSDESEQVFRQLKRSQTNAPVLAYADPSKPYEYHVDASRDRLVRELYQENNGHL